MDSHSYTPHPKHDELLKKHRATWDGLLRVTLYSVIGIVAILALMAAFLTKHP
jgi:hypothetical protein